MDNEPFLGRGYSETQQSKLLTSKNKEAGMDTHLLWEKNKIES